MGSFRKGIVCFISLFFLLFLDTTKIHEANSAITPLPCSEKMPVEWPVAIAKDKVGNMYVAQGLLYNTIGKIDSSGRYSILAGSPNEAGFNDGFGVNAKFNGPADLVVDSNGEYLYVTDYYNHLIRRVRIADGEVTTIAGIAGKPGLVNGTGGSNTATQFYHPSGMSIDKNNNLYIADSTNSVIRKVSAAPNYIVTTFAGNGSRDWKDGPSDEASFNFPEDVAIDEVSGNLYVTENKNQAIRQITPSKNNLPATVTTLANIFGVPHGVAVDSAGVIYFTDSFSNLIGTVTQSGVVRAIAGQSKRTGNADGEGEGAKFNQPLGIMIDSSDKIYIADFQNKSIRVMTSTFNPALNKKIYQVSTLSICPTLIEPVPGSENVGKR